MRSSKEDVDAFLADVWGALDEGKFSPIDRKKNADTLAILGWKWPDAKDELYSLTYMDYFRGPNTDRDCPSDDDFWEFKRRIQGHYIYIKLKVRYSSDNSVMLFSFHKDGM